MRFGRVFCSGSLLLSASVSSFLGYHSYRQKVNDDSKNGVKSLKKLTSWDHNWDLANSNDSPKPQVGSCYKLLILVRHGQYETEALTSNKKVLTDLGWKQARATGKRLRALGYNIDCIVHSDMIRARQTTAGILSELDQMQLADTGILEITANPPLPGPKDCVDLRKSPLKSMTLPLLESSLMAEGPPPTEPEPSPGNLSSVYRRIGGDAPLVLTFLLSSVQLQELST
uniref:Serine/threonine-protein phosphatase PGAM5, mitochondrial n=1 Tax=Mesocestoides corti TaxID=53468 RepID=A0A5K3FJN0_MESCO